VESGDVSAPALPGTKTDVNSDTKPRFAIAYMITDNVSAEWTWACRTSTT
jgi:outer membrane protein